MVGAAALEVEARPGRDVLAPEEDQAERMQAFVLKLEEEARRRVDKRNVVEQRWIEDLQQYHGVYGREVLEQIKKMDGSEIFVPLTATKTDAMVARLWDLLFPTDDRNWGISPTPVPEMTDQAEQALAVADKAKADGDMAHQQAQQRMEVGDEAGAAQAEEQMRAAEQVESESRAAAEALHERLNEAKRRADLMQEEIDDQLVTCRYQAEARDLIEDACKIGIGVIKGPLLGYRAKKKWGRGKEGDAPWSLGTVAEDMPAAYRVDPWSFFPDPNVRRVEDSEGIFERHLMNKVQLRKLADRPDIDPDAVRQLLRIGPHEGLLPAYLPDLHDLTGQTDGDLTRDLFQVWEYTGPIDDEDMVLLSNAFLKDDEEPLTLDDVDPLEASHARVWFCQGRVLSFGLHPLDSNEPLYSTFTIRPDEASPFGYGIPWIMRHPQIILNAAFRMMMDNAGLSTGPQVVVDKDQVEPEDGDWTLRPRKVWNKKNGMTTATGQVIPPFDVFHIPSNQTELAAIIEIARGLIDEVTAMPALAHGEQGTGVTKTAQGMALLMNSANITFRRVVKNFDDDITIPLLSRFYDWNMQFGEKEEIKGDYDVQARGSGVLLVREMQAQNLLMIAQMFVGHPVLGPRLKEGDLLRQIFRAHMIPVDEVTKTDREFEEWLAEQAEQQDPTVALELEKLALAREELEVKRDELDQKAEIANMEWAARREIAQLDYDAAMEKVASTLNMSRAQLDEKVASTQATLASKERTLAAEVAMKERTGESAGGSV